MFAYTEQRVPENRLLPLKFWSVCLVRHVAGFHHSYFQPYDETNSTFISFLNHMQYMIVNTSTNIHHSITVTFRDFTICIYTSRNIRFAGLNICRMGNFLALNAN